NEPTKPSPMSLYNWVCNWVEMNIGVQSIKRTGRAIGARAYDQMIKDESLGAHPTPLEILQQLKRVASFMIQDPLGRGWEILSAAPGEIVMRRTQTFNCLLQEGLLHSLVQRTGVLMPRVDHRTCTRA